jgi:hypothetical protein
MVMSDLLGRRLDAAAEDAGAAARLTEPSRVRVRGDRRRRAVAALAVAASGVVVAGVLVSAGVVVGSGAVPTGGPTHSGMRTQIAGAVRMPHEGDPGWVRNDDPRAHSVFTGCAQGDPTLVGRTDARTMTGRGDAESEKHSPTYAVEQLFLYEDERAAAAAIAAINGTGIRCGWRYAPEGFWLALGASSGNKHVDGWQLGNAVFLVYTEVGGVGIGGVLAVNDIPRMAHELCVVMAICTNPPSPWPTGPPATPTPR